MSSSSKASPPAEEPPCSTSKAGTNTAKTQIETYRKYVSDILCKIELGEKRINSSLNSENKFGKQLLEREMKREVCKKIIEASLPSTSKSA